MKKATIQGIDRLAFIAICEYLLDCGDQLPAHHPLSEQTEEEIRATHAFIVSVDEVGIGFTADDLVAFVQQGRRAR